jgi:hypothetical protein
MAAESAERPPAPQLVEVTVEWHSDRHRSPLASLGTKARHLLAVGAGALIATAGAIVIADSPSRRPAAPRAVPARCEFSSTPRVFIGDSHHNTDIPVHVPACP